MEDVTRCFNYRKVQESARLFCVLTDIVPIKEV